MKTRILGCFAISIMLVISVSLLTACRGETTLADGTYTVDRIYINGAQVESNHLIWSTLAPAKGQWIVVGSKITFSHPALPGVPANSETVDHRIRSGYLEQRGSVTNNRWTRENGSKASAYTSTRVENGEIVFRYGVNSEPGKHFGGTVYIFYALEQPDSGT